MLQLHSLVAQVAVLAASDDLREEEVLACIVLCAAARGDVEASLRTLFEFCHAQLTNYRAPGCVWVTEHIPTTATQKIQKHQKHQIFGEAVDLRSLAGMRDLRAWKKRGALPPERAA